MSEVRPILLVEDDENDGMLFKRAIRKGGIPHPVHWVHNGQEASDFLIGAGQAGADHQLPAIIVLDLKMPRVDGFGLLEWLSLHPEFRSIPTLVLTGSSLT